LINGMSTPRGWYAVSAEVGWGAAAADTAETIAVGEEVVEMRWRARAVCVCFVIS
jgi:hypothetical protein